jgi:predicted porin
MRYYFLNLKWLFASFCLLFASFSSLNAIEVAKVKNTTLAIYGGMGISMVDYSTLGGEVGPIIENETKVGFKINKDIGDGVSFFTQIESGLVGNTGKSGVLGNRDTFVGIKGNFGKIRFGRMLTPMYQIVDWPYSNPGLGRVFDWGNKVPAHYDRQSNQIRFDGKKIGSLSYSLAYGRDKANGATKDSSFYGASASYPVVSMLTLMVGVESAEKFRGKDNDTLGYIVGFDANVNKFGLAGAYKVGSSDDANGITSSQNLFSVVAKYSLAKIQLKLGYANGANSEIDGVEQKNSSSALAGQVLYFVNGGPVVYARVVQVSAEGSDDATIIRLGTEFGF